eukprot:4956636-Pyramimonas_sp.AAC.1
MGSSTEGLSGGVRIRLPHPLHRFVAPWGGSIECPSGGAPSTAFRGRTGGSTQGRSGGVRMRLPHPVQRFVYPEGVPPKAPVAVFAC